MIYMQIIAYREFTRNYNVIKSISDTFTIIAYREFTRNYNFKD